MGQRALAEFSVQFTQSTGVGRLTVFHVKDVAVIPGRCRQPNRTRKALIQEAEGKPPAERAFRPIVQTSRFDPYVVVEQGVDGMASGLARSLHRRQPSKRF